MPQRQWLCNEMHNICNERHLGSGCAQASAMLMGIFNDAAG
jgi:hypothetical protein